MTVRHLAETGSTNSDMLSWATLAPPLAAEEGDWILADRQTAGRGRQGRHWDDGAGNLMASGLVRLRVGDPSAAGLALVAGVALHEALAQWMAADRLMLKWPNDLLADQAKIAGILLERAGDAVVLGFGVNLTHHPQFSDRSVTSLAALGCPVPSPRLLLDRLAMALAPRVARWRGEGLSPQIAAWQACAHPVGTRLSCHGPDGRLMTGLFAGLAMNGALNLKLDDGTMMAIHAGDVGLASASVV